MLHTKFHEKWPLATIFGDFSALLGHVSMTAIFSIYVTQHSLL